jgi:hypothetical protein
MSESALPQVRITMNWALEINVGAAYSFQLEYLSKKPVSRQITESYNLVPAENLFARLRQEEEISIHCLVHALRSLKKPCKVSVLATCNLLESTIESLPRFIETQHLENHRHEIVLKELWGLMKTHQLNYYKQDIHDKTLRAIRLVARNKVLAKKL